MVDNSKYLKKLLTDLQLEALPENDDLEKTSKYSSPRNVPIEKSYPPPENSKFEDLQLFCNAGAKLRKGWLLLGVQKDNSVYQMNPENGDLELICYFLNTPMVLWRVLPLSDGSIIVSISGSRWPTAPDEVAFGAGGYVLHIRHTDESMTKVELDRDLNDPGEILLLPDGNLMVADFNGFGGQGSIFASSTVKPQLLTPFAEKKTALPLQTKTILSGEPLKEPVALNLQDNGLYIANAYMHYEAKRGPGGKPFKETGSILHLNLETESLDIIYDESDQPRGAIDSLGISNNSKSNMYFTRNDWPTHEGSAIMKLNLETRETTSILESSPDMRRFSRVQHISNSDFLFVADSYNKEMLKIHAPSGNIESSYSLKDILGPIKGMVSPLEAVETIVTIP